MDFDFAAIAGPPTRPFDIKSLASDPCTDVLIGRLERFEEKAAVEWGVESSFSKMVTLPCFRRSGVWRLNFPSSLLCCSTEVKTF